MIRSGRPGTCYVFPLGLTQQPIWLTRSLSQPFNELLGMSPSHIDHWPAASAPTCVIRTILSASAVVHACVPLLKRHFVYPYSKRLRNFHPVLRCLPGASPFRPISFRRRCTHKETPGGHGYHPHVPRDLPSYSPGCCLPCLFRLFRLPFLVRRLPCLFRMLGLRDLMQQRQRFSVVRSGAPGALQVLMQRVTRLAYSSARFNTCAYLK